MKQMVKNWKILESLRDFIFGNKEKNSVEIGVNLEVDGNLQINSSILDSEGNEAIDVGTEDLSIHKNVNIGSVDEEEDLFVSGNLFLKSLSNLKDSNGNELVSQEEFDIVIQDESGLTINKVYAKAKRHGNLLILVGAITIANETEAQIARHNIGFDISLSDEIASKIIAYNGNPISTQETSPYPYVCAVHFTYGTGFSSGKDGHFYSNSRKNAMSVLFDCDAINAGVSNYYVEFRIVLGL